VRLNDFDVIMPPDENVRAVPVAHAIRVRPELADWRIASSFYHTYTTTQMQTTTYSCGQTTCTRATPVTVTQTVYDGSCERALSFVPNAGAVYLLQYDFLAANQCSLLCMQQVPAGEGQFTNQPCLLVASPNE
jgi:hypothetical protein